MPIFSVDFCRLLQQSTRVRSTRETTDGTLPFSAGDRLKFLPTLDQAIVREKKGRQLRWLVWVVSSSSYVDWGDVGVAETVLPQDFQGVLRHNEVQSVSYAKIVPFRCSVDPEPQKFREFSAWINVVE